MARADREWLNQLVTRRESPADFKRALARQPDDVKVVIRAHPAGPLDHHWKSVPHIGLTGGYNHLRLRFEHDVSGRTFRVSPARGGHR